MGLLSIFKKLFKPKPTILIIDDDENLLAVTRTALRFEGYKVLLANHGGDGLRLAIKKKPSLIILDILMPGLDGWEVLSGLRESPKTQKIPVILLTKVDQTGQITKGFDLGANQYLIKPLNTKKLYNKIREVLKKES